MTDSWPDRGGHLWPKDREVVGPDGTVIRYTVRGPGGAPAVVCCAGFLCPDNFWRDIGPRLARDRRVVVLNYRGVGASSEARGGDRPPSARDYTLDRLAGDVACVLDRERIEHATVVGHSMGVQVALALWRAHPQLVGRLALIAGPGSSPFRTWYGLRHGAAAFPLVSMAVPALPRVVSGPAMRALELPGAMAVARAIHALGPRTPLEGMRDYREHMGRVDPRTAIWTARGMHAFDAGPWLHEVDVPTLVMAGDADAWAPVTVGEDLAGRIPGARLVVVEEASHALPIEFPELVLTQLRALIDAPGRT